MKIEVSNDVMAFLNQMYVDSTETHTFYKVPFIFRADRNKPNVLETVDKMPYSIDIPVASSFDQLLLLHGWIKTMDIPLFLYKNEDSRIPFDFKIAFPVNAEDSYNSRVEQYKKETVNALDEQKMVISFLRCCHIEYCTSKDLLRSISKLASDFYHRHQSITYCRTYEELTKKIDDCFTF